MKVYSSPSDYYLIGDFKDWQDDAKFEKALDTLVARLPAAMTEREEERVVSYL
ncbi:MAG: hypothetical protein IPM82_12565 [Saprospiraceae bacterium]|nr:hypothetical protein [Saprospiraceae bacterium]